MHVLFTDGKEFYTVSDQALDFPDFEMMESKGKMKRITEGTKKEIKEYELEHEPQLEEL